MGKLKNVIVTTICGAVLIGGGATLIVSQVEKSNCQKQINQMFETYNFSGEDNEKLQNEFVEKNFSSEDKQKYQTLVAKQQDWQEYGDVLGSSATVFGVTSVAALGVSKILKSKGVDTEEILEEIVNELYNSEYGKNDLAKFSTKVKEKKYSRSVQEDKFQM